MVERVIATETAQALIARLRARHGEQLMFFQSGGCCDGSAPMCYLVGELTTGPHDRLLGHIGGCPFYINASQYAYWQHTQLVIDVTAGHGDNFSLEGSEGVSFITRSRLFTDAEWEALTPLD